MSAEWYCYRCDRWHDSDCPQTPAHPVQGEARADVVEVFRAALMRAHANDWDMETVSEAAHICANAAAAEVEQLKAHLSAAHDLIDFIRDEHVIDWREKLTTSGADEALGLLSAFDTISDARRLTEHGAEPR